MCDTYSQGQANNLTSVGWYTSGFPATPGDDFEISSNGTVSLRLQGEQTEGILDVLMCESLVVKEDPEVLVTCERVPGPSELGCRVFARSKDDDVFVGD